MNKKIITIIIKVSNNLLNVLDRLIISYEAIPMKETILELFVHIIHELA